MVSESGSSKRPMCQSCSKPAQLCLCCRLKTPCLQNSIAVTILQHSLEKNHPLNSTRIASIGLKNLSVVSVYDVNHEARFLIRLLSSNLDVGSLNLDEKTRSENLEKCDLGMTGMCELDEVLTPDVKKIESLSDSRMEVLGDYEEAAIDFSVGKFGAICSFRHCWQEQNQDLSQLLATRAAVDDLRKGFSVKKLQRKPINGSFEYKKYDEFEFAVAPGSVLLFPSENSVGIEDIDFEVKNLIVLDGTWAKAKRMYNENPWLKFLPHLKLDIEKLSLYKEVRLQPRAGYLSTIESIVYALKAVGEEDDKGLDNLLDVFESMIADQRRCKEERLRQIVSI